MATLKKIALASGVSIRTVGRFLNKNGYVSLEKAEKIQKVLNKENYVPNLLARGLRNKRTRIIGIIAYELSLEVLSKKFQACQLELALHNYGSMLALSGGDLEREEKFCLEYTRFCDGIIFLNDPSDKSLHILESTNIPYVIADSYSDNLHSIPIDRGSGIVDAIKQFSDKYSNFYFLTAFQQENDQRKLFFEKGVILSKIKSSNILKVKGDSSFSQGFSIAKSVIKKKNSLCICYNDRIAAGLLRGLYELEVNIPKEFGIIGFDNDNFTLYTHKTISTIAQSVKDLAEKTFLLLKEQIDKNLIQKVSIKTKFIGRETTL